MQLLLFISSLSLLFASYLLGAGHFWIALYLFFASWIASFFLLGYSHYFIEDNDDAYIKEIKPHGESFLFHLVLVFFAFTMGKVAIWPGLIGLALVGFLFQEQLITNPFFALCGLYFYDCVTEKGNGFVLISTEVIKAPCYVSGLQRLTNNVYLQIVPSV